MKPRLLLIQIRIGHFHRSWFSGQGRAEIGNGASVEPALTNRSLRSCVGSGLGRFILFGRLYGQMTGRQLSHLMTGRPSLSASRASVLRSCTKFIHFGRPRHLTVFITNLDSTLSGLDVVWHDNYSAPFMTFRSKSGPIPSNYDLKAASFRRGTLFISTVWPSLF